MKSDCTEFDNGHEIAEYNSPTPNNDLRATLINFIMFNWEELTYKLQNI